MEHPPARLAGSVLGPRRHVCGLFRSQSEAYDTLLPFIREGLARGEKAVHIIDPRRCDEHDSRLADAGIDTGAATRSGQLDVRGWYEAHLLDGVFDGARTVAVIDHICRQSVAGGFSRIRFVTQMEWVVESATDPDTLLAYEASVNLEPIEHPVVCAYDVTKFRGDLVVDVMRTHPMILVGGVLQENPFFVPAETLLGEISLRKR